MGVSEPLYSRDCIPDHIKSLALGMFPPRRTQTMATNCAIQLLGRPAIEQRLWGGGRSSSPVGYKNFCMKMNKFSGRLAAFSSMNVLPCLHLHSGLDDGQGTRGTEGSQQRRRRSKCIAPSRKQAIIGKKTDQQASRLDDENFADY